METTRLSRREIIRQLGTSPSQLYRLLDPLTRARPSIAWWSCWRCSGTECGRR